MNPAQATRLEKEKHPGRFCWKQGCLWREAHRDRLATPCPKHGVVIDLMEALKRSLAEGAVTK